MFDIKCNLINSKLKLFVLFFACLWTIHEWYKSVGFLAYPWGTVLMSAYRWKTLTQIVSIVGTFGISFLFSLFTTNLLAILSCIA